MAAELLSLAGRTALVTGGAGGIGQAIAVALVRSGARVGITVNQQPADATVAEVKTAGSKRVVTQDNLAEPGAADAAPKKPSAAWNSETPTTSRTFLTQHGNVALY
jgi:2-deoxy-D-gluconate 3-dehydrogenase